MLYGMCKRMVRDFAASGIATVGLTAILCFGSSLAALAEPSAQAILVASDSVRNPSKPFSVTTSLVEYRGGKHIDDATLVVYSRANEGSGEFNSLVQFIAPVRDANKLILKNGNDLWLYDPGSKASIRLSPQQRLLGQAANGDVVTVNLAHDYRAERAVEEEVSDGDRQLRRSHRLDLVAVRPGVTYHRIELWVAADSSKPIKGKFYAESGQLLKTAFYRRYQMQLGMERPTETVIIDGLDPRWVTVLRYNDFAWRDVPMAWLQREFLPHFKAN